MRQQLLLCSLFLVLASAAQAKTAKESQVVVHVVDSDFHFYEHSRGHWASLKVVMPDGSSATLECSADGADGKIVNSNRTNLDAGDYPAEIKGNTVWLTVSFAAEKQKYSSDVYPKPFKRRAMWPLETAQIQQKMASHRSSHGFRAKPYLFGPT